MPEVLTSDGTAIAYEVRGTGAPLYVCHGGPSTTHRYLAEGDLMVAGTQSLVVNGWDWRLPHER